MSKINTVDTISEEKRESNIFNLRIKIEFVLRGVDSLDTKIYALQRSPSFLGRAASTTSDFLPRSLIHDSSGVNYTQDCVSTI